MKRRYKIFLLTIGILLLVSIVFSMFRPGGVLNQFVLLPIVKPFSEPCGYRSTSEHKVSCSCDGFLVHETGDGAASSYCTGQCGQCECYEQDWSISDESGESKLTKIDCKTLPELGWAFPLE